MSDSDTPAARNLIGSRKARDDLLDTTQHSLIADTPTPEESLHMVRLTEEEVQKMEEKKGREARRRASLQQLLGSAPEEEPKSQPPPATIASANTTKPTDNLQEQAASPRCDSTVDEKAAWRRQEPDDRSNNQFTPTERSNPHNEQVSVAVSQTSDPTIDEKARWRRQEAEDRSTDQLRPAERSIASQNDEANEKANWRRQEDEHRSSWQPSNSRSEGKSVKPGVVHVNKDEHGVITNTYNALVNAKSEGRETDPASDPAYPDLPDDLMPMPLPDNERGISSGNRSANSRTSLPSLPGAHRGHGMGSAGPTEHLRPLYKGGMHVLGRQAAAAAIDASESHRDEPSEESLVRPDVEQPPLINADVEAALEKEEPKSTFAKYYKVAAIAFAVLLVLVIAIVAAVVATSSGSSDSERNEASDTPAPEPTTTDWFLPVEAVFSDPHELALVPESTRQAIESQDLTLSQVEAYQWLVQDSNRILYSAAQLRQRLALATFFYATNGPNWFDQAGTTTFLNYNEHECEWQWFSLLKFPPCRNFTHAENPWDQHVPFRSLALPGDPENSIEEMPQLRGSLVPELVMLTSLETLDVSNQKLQGPIPTELSQLSSSLHYIDLHECFFTGTIPDGLYEFPKQLRLFKNPRLDPGIIPTTIGLNPHLSHLVLADANIGGTLPTQIGLLSSSALLLDVNTNNLGGKVPSQVGQLTKLQALRFVSNSLTGGLPTSISLLSNLVILEATRNRALNWQLVPEEFLSAASTAAWPKLTRLNMGQTALSGSLPSEIGLLVSLAELNLPFNRLEGQLPSELGLLTALSRVDVSNNEGMTGPVPVELCALPNLELKGPLQC